jgi:hypothetical protein
MVTSGSAPISPEVMDFLKIAFACEVAEGMPYFSLVTAMANSRSLRVGFSFITTNLYFSPYLFLTVMA